MSFRSFSFQRSIAVSFVTTSLLYIRRSSKSTTFVIIFPVVIVCHLTNTTFKSYHVYQGMSTVLKSLVRTLLARFNLYNIIITI
ncbi:hypothetical protein FM106_06435 [Brachybacterium faecium]|nr:hypothetical protein FM106_06435 [Brachybacterium faecium]